VISDRSIPGEGLVYRLFDLVGETRPSMMLTRQAARFAKGWHRDQVREAGEQAADALAEAVQPFARPLLDDHRAAGRRLVLATTTPGDMIRPLADRLGFDAVVATRYGLDGGGRYDGTIDGEFVWGKGKLRAVRSWAAANGVSLDESWAYSDSYYDNPLLGAVGNPVAVNPDPRLLAVAVVRRWPVIHLDVPAGVPKVPS
jgi:putative phosphoserine phosphatase/1-acylglycerol-3-phosphate O-acyltransferase